MQASNVYDVTLQQASPRSIAAVHARVPASRIAADFSRTYLDPAGEGKVTTVCNAFSRSLVIGLLAVGLAPQASRCQSHIGPDSSAVIPLRAGQNPVDLLGTGKLGAIDVADRENYNAHGHHLALFQVRAPRYADDPKSADEWQIVPFFASDTAAAEEIFHTVEGADCILRDLRILRGRAGQPVTVVIAERALRRSYADSEAVQFQFYELRTNASGVVGYPSYYFERTRVVEARRAYCDVDDAFDRELHLGRTGLVRWDGPR